jgi:hypothetical protein
MCFCINKHLNECSKLLGLSSPFARKRGYKNTSKFKCHPAGKVALCRGQCYGPTFRDNIPRNRNSVTFTLCTMDCTDKGLEDLRLTRLAELLRYFIGVIPKPADWRKLNHSWEADSSVHGQAVVLTYYTKVLLGIPPPACDVGQLNPLYSLEPHFVSDNFILMLSSMYAWDFRVSSS